MTRGNKTKGGFYYDRKGKRLELWEWAELFEDQNYRFLRKDEVGDLLISTIWVGVDLSGSGFENEGTGFEAMFETCVFVFEHSEALGKVIERRRWATEAEALAGHKTVLKEFKKKNSAPKRRKSA